MKELIAIGCFLRVFLKISVNRCAFCGIQPNSFQFRLGGFVPPSCVVSKSVSWYWGWGDLEIGGTLAKEVVSWDSNTDQVR